ncbi:FkbM family methyltransferase [Pantoea brenneri]|uniref:FkbM family methyltransferase n=1 Tax=Pantoea brenneri TaxID=472694 RepID=UPI0028A26068|nr:FkbM family methyltransferase [Pantoea brenneri]
MLPKVHVVNSSQGSFLTFGNDAISQHLFTHGNWESWLVPITNEFIQGFIAPVVFDLGANLGAYTVPIALQVEKQKGQVYAFEPQKTIYYQLCGNIFLNRLDNVTALNYAVGHHSCFIDIAVPDYHKTHNIGAFSMDEQFRTELGTQASMSNEKDSIQLVKLDDIIPDNKVRFLKIDVEGLEIDVLRGALNFLEQNNFPPFSFEAWSLPWFSEKRRELLTFILQLGYQIEHIQMDDYVAHHPANEAKVEFVRDQKKCLQKIHRIG